MKEVGFIHIVDDDRSIQSALSRLLGAAGYNVRCYQSAGEFLLVEPPDENDGCMVLDVRMPGPNGLELQQAMVTRGYILPIIFLSGYGDVSACARAMKMGAVDFLTKPVRREILLPAIRTALARSREERLRSKELLRFQMCFESLNGREKEVFTGVVSGKLNKEIAADIGAAERTVKVHRSHLMKKMNASSLAELVHISDLLSFGPRPRS